MSLIDRLNLIFTSLIASLGMRVRERAIGVAIGEGVYRRIDRTRRVVEALIRRLQAGTLREWARREVARERAAPGVATRARLAEVMRGWAAMPRRFGWLCPLVPCTERYRDCAALYGMQLAAVLQDPEMRRMMALSPRIGRALRPVCRMLHVDPALLEVTAAEAAALAEALAEAAVVAAGAAVVAAAAEVVAAVAAPVAEPEAAPAPREPTNVPWWRQPWAQ